jgi:hypothetical protein
MRLCINKHSQIPDAAHASEGRFTQIVIKTMTDCVSTKESISGFVDV